MWASLAGADVVDVNYASSGKKIKKTATVRTASTEHLGDHSDRPVAGTLAFHFAHRDRHTEEKKIEK